MRDEYLAFLTAVKGNRTVMKAILSSKDTKRAYESMILAAVRQTTFRDVESLVDAICEALGVDTGLINETRWVAVCETASRWVS